MLFQATQRQLVLTARVSFKNADCLNARLFGSKHHPTPLLVTTYNFLTLRLLTVKPDHNKLEITEQNQSFFIRILSL